MQQSAAMHDQESPSQLAELADDLDRFRLDLVGVEATRRTLVDRLRGYLMPRQADSSQVLVVVVIGPSGSGKSTLVNSIAGRRVSAEGVVRPTTTEPVAWCDGALPPTLDALRSSLPGRIVDAFKPPPDGVVLVDAPPPSVVDESGRSVAEQLIAVADACLFVVSGIRYADADGFDMLDRVAARKIPVSFVLNRLPVTTEIQRLLVEDMATKLYERGHLPRTAEELIIAVAEGPVSPDTGGLPGDWVYGVRKEVESLADPQTRALTLEANIAAALASVRSDLGEIRSALIDEATHQVELMSLVEHRYEVMRSALTDRLSDGDFAELASSRDEIVSGLAAVATRAAGVAARESGDAWSEHEVGRRLLARRPSLFTHGGDTLEEARARVAWWLDEIEALVRRHGHIRRRRRRQRFAALVAGAVLDPDSSLGRRRSAKVAKVRALVGAAQARLVDELAGILDVDARRFAEMVGPVVAPGVLSRLEVEVVS